MAKLILLSVLGQNQLKVFHKDLSRATLLTFALKDIEVCNFADDTTPLFVILISILEENSAMALTWFETNYMKLNNDKCHLLVSGHHYEEMFVKIGNDRIWESKR